MNASQYTALLVALVHSHPEWSPKQIQRAAKKLRAGCPKNQ